MTLHSYKIYSKSDLLVSVNEIWSFTLDLNPFNSMTSGLYISEYSLVGTLEPKVVCLLYTI